MDKSFLTKKRLLIILATLAPIPLPFNELISYSTLILYIVALLPLFIQTTKGKNIYLPKWLLNLAGIVYIPIFFLDTQISGGLITPIVHLTMFTTYMKTWSLKEEREKWQLLLIITTLFLVSVGTSTHLTITIFIFIYIVFLIYTLFFFVYSSLAKQFTGGISPKDIKLVQRTSAYLALTTTVIAIPLFAFFPRLNEPYVTSGISLGNRYSISGFSDYITIGTIGTIRTNREIVARITVKRGNFSNNTIRFKVSTYDTYEPPTWQYSKIDKIIHDPEGIFYLNKTYYNDKDVSTEIEIWQRKISPIRNPILVPPNITVIQFDDASKINSIALDRGDAIFIPPNLPSVNYKVFFSAKIQPPISQQNFKELLDYRGLGSRAQKLTEEITKNLPTDYEKARAIEQFLQSSYKYSVNLSQHWGEDAIERFLFEEEEGHCELFASTMVLMLRYLGIPARLVGGYLGAEKSLIDDSYLVRQANAHAWVEAYIDEEGWLTFDPTPPDGRPTIGNTRLLDVISDFYTSLVFAWDRYVISYSFEDQIKLFIKIKEYLSTQIKKIIKLFKVKSPKTEEKPIPHYTTPTTTTTDNYLQNKEYIPILLALIIFIVGITLSYRQIKLKSAPALYTYLKLRKLMRKNKVIPHLNYPPKIMLDYLSKYTNDKRILKNAELIVESYLRERFNNEKITQGEIKIIQQAYNKVYTHLASLSKTDRTVTS